MADMDVIARSPEHAIKILDRALNEGDLDAIMDLYEDVAVVVPQPGIEARGKDVAKQRGISQAAVALVC